MLVFPHLLHKREVQLTKLRRFDESYRRSLEEPEAFWAEAAAAIGCKSARRSSTGTSKAGAPIRLP